MVVLDFILEFIKKFLWYVPWGIGIATIIAVIGNCFKKDNNDDIEDDEDYEDE